MQLIDQSVHGRLRFRCDACLKIFVMPTPHIAEYHQCKDDPLLTAFWRKLGVSREAAPVEDAPEPKPHGRKPKKESEA